MDATRCLDNFDPDFKYKFSNDSHSWLINFPDSLKPDPSILKISSKNETYTEHEIQRQSTKGKRKKLMEDFYRKVITEEIIGNLEGENVTIEEYVTDYMERFKNPDDMPLPGEMLSKNEKIKKESDYHQSLSNEPSKKSKLEEKQRGMPLQLVLGEVKSQPDQENKDVSPLVPCKVLREMGKHTFLMTWNF